MTPYATSLGLSCGHLSMYAMACPAAWRSYSAGERENRGVLALVERCFLLRVACSAECRHFLWAGDAVRRSTTLCLAMLDAVAVTGIAAERFGCVRMRQEILHLLGMAGLTERVNGLSGDG